MDESKQIVAGGPWSDLNGGPNKPSPFWLRDAAWIMAATVILLVVGTGLLCLAIWVFAAK